MHGCTQPHYAELSGYIIPSSDFLHIEDSTSGALAHLVEHLVCIQKVRGSNPLGSTITILHMKQQHISKFPNPTETGGEAK